MKRCKRLGKRRLFDEIISYNNIKKAIYSAAKGHRREDKVLWMLEHIDEAIVEIRDMIIKGFRYGKFVRRTITERGKKRKLMYTETYPDRVVQHAVFNVVTPILHSTIPSTAFAAVKGRGIHKGAQKVFSDMQKDWRGTRFSLKMDIYHFFQSIDRDVLFDMLKRRIKCRRTLDILHTFIFGAPKSGLPIGLYSSQILSVFYLSSLDHYCKERLGIKYYYRYMDDIVILSSDKTRLHNIRRYIARFLHDKLNLRVKGNWAVFPVMKRRLDFMGFVMNHHHVAIRKSTKLSMKKAYIRLKKALKSCRIISNRLWNSFATYLGLLSWISSPVLRTDYIHMINNAISIYPPVNRIPSGFRPYILYPSNYTYLS